MKNENAYQESIENIHYQSKKIVWLSNTFNISMQSAMGEVVNKDLFLSQSVDNQIIFKAQVDADSLLNSFASLVDYYYICTAIKMDVHPDKINTVQYKKITNSLVTKNKTWQSFINELKEKLTNKVDWNDHWSIFFYIWSDVIKSELVKWGVMEKEQLAFTEEIKEDGKLRITPHPLVLEYHRCTEFMNCNRTGMGHKYNIFLELNNFLKHNRYPLIKYETQQLDCSTIAYPFYTIHQRDYHFLKPGVLQSFAQVDFTTLKDALASRMENEGKYTELEVSLGMPLLGIDPQHGYEYDSALYFYLDDVLIARGEDYISINSLELFRVSGDFLREIGSILDCSFITNKHPK